MKLPLVLLRDQHRINQKGSDNHAHQPINKTRITINLQMKSLVSVDRFAMLTRQATDGLLLQAIGLLGETTDFSTCPLRNTFGSFSWFWGTKVLHLWGQIIHVTLVPTFLKILTNPNKARGRKLTKVHKNGHFLAFFHIKILFGWHNFHFQPTGYELDDYLWVYNRSNS